MRVLRTENDQLVRDALGLVYTVCIYSCPAMQRKGKAAATAGDGDPNLRKVGESDQNVRKALARQHVKDISEYTKQIHAKDREIADLKRKTIKVGISLSDARKYWTSLNVYCTIQ